MATTAPEHGEKIIDPIHQFVINRIIPLDIGGIDISFKEINRLLEQKSQTK